LTQVSVTEGPAVDDSNAENEEQESSLGVLAAQKKDLTKDVRKAGISDKDEAFLDSFSDTMSAKDKETKEEYVPSDKEID